MNRFNRKLPDNIYTLKNEVYHFNFKATAKWLELVGKELFGQEFKLQRADLAILYKLLIWAIRDEENCKKHNISLKKGFMLVGPVGSGKTCFMTLLKSILPVEINHMVKPCREVAYEFSKEGFAALQNYGKKCLVRHQSKLYPKAICFDDLGSEQNINYYGTVTNTMAEIILIRYDQLVANGAITHITTNLTPSEIEKHYGNRIRSRMRSMFNLIAFPAETKDKRV